MKMSRNTCDPPKRVTSDTEGPTALKSCPRKAASRLASPLYLLNTALQTLRNVSRSHVRTKTRVSSNLSSKCLLNWPYTFAQPTTRNNYRGNIPFSKIDWKQKSAVKNWNKYVIYRNPYVICTEQLRILTSTPLRDQQTSKFMELAVNENCAHNCYTGSWLPPKRSTSSKDETLATTGNCGSTTPDWSQIRSSHKEY